MATARWRRVQIEVYVQVIACARCDKEAEQEVERVERGSYVGRPDQPLTATGARDPEGWGMVSCSFLPSGNHYFNLCPDCGPGAAAALTRAMR